MWKGNFLTPSKAPFAGHQATTEKTVNPSEPLWREAARISHNPTLVCKLNFVLFKLTLGTEVERVSGGEDP